MIFGFAGNMRGGKTLNATAWGCFLAEKYHAPIIANYHINHPNFVQYFEKWHAIKETKNTIIIVDEIATMVDSRNTKSEDQMYFTHLFNQMGKKWNTFIYTTQRIHMVEKRVREQTDYSIWHEKDYKHKKLIQTWYDTRQIPLMCPQTLIRKQIMINPEHYYNLYDTYEEIQTTLSTAPTGGENRQKFKPKTNFKQKYDKSYTNEY